VAVSPGQEIGAGVASRASGQGGVVQHWKLDEIATPLGSRSPVILHSVDGETRAVLIGLQPGQELGEHQVKEAAFVLVLDGSVRVEAGDEALEAGAGELFRFAPDERRSVASSSGARVLLMLSPWPGEGHYRGDRAASGISASPSGDPAS
jgi:quercetin dioxygenase-like cupin family protein